MNSGLAYRSVYPGRATLQAPGSYLSAILSCGKAIAMGSFNCQLGAAKP